MTTDSYEKTFQLPVNWDRGADGYVKDNAEWVARCLARVSELDPMLKAEEAQVTVDELSQLQRWRLMSPEAAAEQLYAPIRRAG